MDSNETVGSWAHHLGLEGEQGEVVVVVVVVEAAGAVDGAMVQVAVVAEVVEDLWELEDSKQGLDSSLRRIRVVVSGDPEERVQARLVVDLGEAAGRI